MQVRIWQGLLTPSMTEQLKSPAVPMPDAAKGMVVKLCPRQVHDPVIPLEDIYPGEAETCACTKPCIQMFTPG